MAIVKDNFRVMIVRNKKLKHKDKVYCSIRVGVGYEDDPPHYKGLPHLLEHVICFIYDKNHSYSESAGETTNFETIFSFDDYLKNISGLAETMFSNGRINNDIMEMERNRVDNEYQENRNLPDFTAHRTVEILKQKKDITVVNFGNVCHYEPFGRLRLDMAMFNVINFRAVTSMVHHYFQFLRNNWQKIDMKPLIKSIRKTIDAESGIVYAEYIARCLGRVSEPFDEEDLFRPLTEGKQLISEQILNNKSIQHTIAARDVDDVYRTLAENSALVAKGNRETEDIFGTQFHFLETGLFAAHNNYDNFTLPQLKPKFRIDEGEHLLLPFYINKASDEAFLALCAHYLELNTEHLVAGHKLKNDGKKYGTQRWLEGLITLFLKRKDTYKYSKRCHPINDVDFDYYKQSLMEKYSLTMTNSHELARSLLETALQNLTSNIKRDSIPLQYNVLKGMDFSKYKNHFQKRHEEIDYEALDKRIQGPDHQFEIKSINVNESTTVTLVFLQQPKVIDQNNLQRLVDYLHKLLKVELVQNLYSRSCSVCVFGAAKGILLKLVSVEEKPDQTGEKIRELLGDKMNAEVNNKFRASTDVSKLWNEMRHHRITIQIVGHKKGVYPSGSFQKYFETWFRHHKDKFNEINDIGKKLQTKHAK
ncbi:hypothetical protein HA402_001451 [Bradysia odoriphaga]|nr:hypothetical protein HA402_001451 [Bradysia odoriphaga]